MKLAEKLNSRIEKLLGKDPFNSNRNEEVQIDEGLYDPSIFKAVFLAGGPGSGKSFVAKNTTGGHGFKMVNSDLAFEMLMKEAGVSLKLMDLTPQQTAKKDQIRDRAKDLTKMRLQNYIAGKLGVIIDGTGKDAKKIEAQKKKLEALGYDCYMIFVNTSLEVALERDTKRERSVGAELVTKMWNTVQNNIGAFQKMFSPRFVIIDNNNAQQDVLLHVWKEVGKFAKKPVKNPIAVSWIKAEIEKRMQA